MLLLVHNTPIQLLIILFFCTLFVVMLSTLAKTRTAEMFMTGAAYAAVLVVFLSGNAGINS